MKILLSIAISLLILFSAVRYLEIRSIYFPMKDIMVTPASAGLSYEDTYFATSDGIRLNGWFIPAHNARYTVLFCHGNAGNIGHRIKKIEILNDIGLNVFVFDWRGYGKSEGVPSEAGLYRDAEAAYKYLTEEKKILPADIVFYGESIGSAVVIELALKERARAIITEECFTSVKDMAALVLPIIPCQLLASRFDSVSKIKDIKINKLIIHSVDDEIVPYSQGESLFAAAALPKKFLKLRGGHNTAFLESEREYREGIKSFLAGL
ncbi:MAG: alpha/beta hydrolase [Candidatus Omnitrophica bacterium]|nr:alpha/beta hydrolase [Candidatus Omnitrophota bacterium]